MEYQKLKYQAAGHAGPLVDTEGKLLFKPTVPQEADFYTSIQATKELPTNDLSLAIWMPRFIGTLIQGVQNVPASESITFLQDGEVPEHLLNNAHLPKVDKKYIVLENLLYGFNKPNVLDIKLGKILHDQNASEEKKTRLKSVSKNTTSGSLGIRICGMTIERNSLTNIEQDFYEVKEDGYILIKGRYGSTRTLENILDAFKLYFGNDKLSASRRFQLARIFKERLQLFFNTILDEEVRMYSTSLLFIYEGDPSRWDKVNDKDCILRSDFIDTDSEDGEDDADAFVAPLSSMSLIDFAHSTLAKGMGYDENVIEGVESLISIFEKLCDFYG
ncbi:HBR115Cp [Eremothecium sinecaudum]|uniref:Kinase n=1 Tax=Eremothecium sinecaudum TaxID=45286 RepID=A0A109UWT8_9SACH|nr:HBR115Cp [Eremothecium sinecaudum]AMD19016.1 HBR115Cp [Eremothecium sinecaudum]